MGGLVAADALRRIGALEKRVLGLVAMGTPWRGSYEAVRNLRGEGDNIVLFQKLTTRSMPEILETVHSFWGLTDLLPGHQPALLDPTLYASGPLAKKPNGREQLAAVARLQRTPPHRALGIVCSSKDTIVNASVVDGEILMEHGPGDSTVPTWSATAANPSDPLQTALPFVEVSQSHATLPLDREAISHAVEQVGRWHHGDAFTGRLRLPDVSVARVLAHPDGLGPDVRARLLVRLAEPEGKGDAFRFRLDDLMALLPLL